MLESSDESPTSADEIHFETCDAQKLENLTLSKSCYVQTDQLFLSLINQRASKNKMTQTSKLPDTTAADKTKMKSKTTQIDITSEMLLQNITTNPQSLVSSYTQTDPVGNNTYEMALDDLHSDQIENQPASDDEYDEFEEESDEGINGDNIDVDLNRPKPVQQMTLSSNKPPQDQMKFIIFEESIVNRFGVCLTCKSTCTVTLQAVPTLRPQSMFAFLQKSFICILPAVQ